MDAGVTCNSMSTLYKLQHYYMINQCLYCFCLWLVFFTDFHAWKNKEEDATLSHFVKARGDSRRIRQSIKVQYYYCHRSGRYVGKDGRLRHLKIQGSCKINRCCPAAIFAKFLSNGMLQCILITSLRKQFPLVLWCCWLGSRKCIQPIKIECWAAGVVLCLEQSVHDLHMVHLPPPVVKVRGN